MPPQIKEILRALLFSTSEPLSLKDLRKVFDRYREERLADLAEGGSSALGQEEAEEAASSDAMLEVETVQIEKALHELVEETRTSGDIYRVLAMAGAYRMAVKPELAEWVRLLRGEPKPKKLSAAAMETLAVIAYRQPVTRAELEAIRGVSADGAISRLMEHGLIEVLGRADLPGRPSQFGTTGKFLEFCGLDALADLPASDVLSHTEVDAWLDENSVQRKPLGDKDMGLPEEEPKADGPSGEEAAGADPQGGEADGTDGEPPAVPKIIYQPDPEEDRAFFYQDEEDDSVEEAPTEAQDR